MLSHVPHFHLHLETILPFFDQWGYLIIGLGAFLEGLPIIGFFSPGAVTLLFGGFLAKAGILDFQKLLILASVCAFLGDLVAYMVGRYYGQHFLKKYGRFFFLKEKHIEETQKLLQKHPGKAIILGRFHFFTRALAPFLAGVSNISIIRFSIYGLFASVLWAVLHVVAGFILGASFAAAARFINIVFFVGIILMVLIFYGYRFIETHRHIFEKYHLTALIFNLLSIYLFIKVLEDIIDREWLFRADFILSRFIPHLWNPTLITVMTIVTNLFSPLHVFLFSCVFIIFLLSKKRYYHALLSTLAISFGAIAQYLLKLLFGFTRPVDGILSVSNYSFPSGHATLVAIFGILIFHCLRRDLKSRWAKDLLLFVMIIMILIVGFSRIYLNVHWLSDILGGYALGIFSVTFFILFLRWGAFFGKEILRIGRAILWPQA